MKKAKQPATKLGDSVAGGMMEARNLEGDEPIGGKLNFDRIREFLAKKRQASRSQHPPSDSAFNAGDVAERNS